MKQVQSKFTRAEIAQKILQLEGYPYSLAQYPMFIDIFNSDFSRKMMRAGRQVSKTITLSANMITDVSITPYHPVIYANSSSQQTQAFSTSKLDPFLIQSPIIYKSLMKSKHVINNVFSKRLTNFSEIHLSYFSESADRLRGTSGNSMYLDEVQDMLYDAMIDAEECLSAARNPTFTYAGTSKTTGSALEYLWSISTQKEWVMKCSGCNKWNRPSLEMIGKTSIICKACGKTLDPYAGMWHAFNPLAADKEKAAQLIDGFWIPQIILPMHCLVPDKWARLLDKLEKYPRHRFLNEVMGLPVGNGDQTITEDLVHGMCIETLPMLDSRCPENANGATHIVAGIDWGGGGGSGTSRTVLSIYAVYPEREQFIKIHGAIYSAGEPSQHVENIANRLRRFGVVMVFGDHGGGNFAMSQLKALVPDIRVIPVMYTEQNRPYKWDDIANRYTVNRTVMIDSFLMDVKQGRVKAFRWSEFKPFAEDLQSVYEEIIGEEKGVPRRVWRRNPAKPDDALHSMVFGWFACRVVSGMLDFTSGQYKMG